MTANIPEPTEDPLGRRALFSSEEPEPSQAGAVVVECSTCLSRTRISLLELLRLAFPFWLHVPLIRRYPSLLRCPTCGRRTWVRVACR
jgi:hypothetical protein